MKMKKAFRIVFLSFVIAISTLISCDKEGAADDGSNSNADGTSHEEASDYSWDSSSEIPIVLNGTSITASSSDVSVSGTTVTIIGAGNYRISGSLSNGQIVVDAEDELVRLIFDGVSITNASSSAVVILNSAKTIINLVAGTTNTITDATAYTSFIDEDLNAALFSKSDLTLFGDGSLTVNGNYNDGITSKDGLIIKSGTYNVTAVDDGIRGKDYLIVEGGTYTVTAGGDGIKSDNEDGSTVGYIDIEAGDFNVTSAGDGISAQTNVTISGSGTYTIKTGGGSGNGTTTNGYTGTTSAKAIKGLAGVEIDGGTFTLNSADDALHSNSAITINGGTINISTEDDAIHADASATFNGGTISVSKCYEGVESALITVNEGAYISVVATDDSFNATKGSATESDDGSYIYIKGGTVALNSSTGDGLDSNGSIQMSAGTVIVQGPSSQPELGMDYNGTCNVSEGLFIASGPNSGNMIQTLSTTSSQYSVKISAASGMNNGSNLLSASTLFHIQDASGNGLITFKPIRNTYYVVFSSPGLARSITYSIYTGGTASGTNINGLYADGTYSGGTLKKSFTLSNSSTVTSVSL